MNATLPLNKSYISIKKILAKDTYAVRHPVLRPSKPIESCKFNGDDFDTTFHLGLFYKNKLVAVASYMLNTNDSFLKNKQYQLRGMAVLNGFKGMQLGNLLLKKGEDLCIKNCVNFIWCNARETAINFYKRNNYQVKGPFFNIEGVGTHVLMYKELTKNY